LSIFNGLTSQGVWTLEIYDNANGDEGVLNGWSLDVTLAGITTFLEPFRVTDANGCEQVQELEVIDWCKSLVRFPNAMMPENPDKDFRVFIDPDVDHVEVFIYQRTGELIHYCESTHPDPSGPVCVWNGWINGKKVSIGTYPLVIKYKSNALGIDRVVKASIVVVE
jgi:hypothetical protein